MKNFRIIVTIVLVCVAIVGAAQNRLVVGFSIGANPLTKLDSLGRPDANLPMLFIASAGLRDVAGVVSGKICLGSDSTQVENILAIPFTIESIGGRLAVRNGNFSEQVSETPQEVLANQPAEYAIKYNLMIPFEMVKEKDMQWRYSRIYLYDVNGNVLGGSSFIKP